MEVIDKIIDFGGDSILKNYHYAYGVLMLDMYHSDFDKNVKIRIKTDYLIFNNYYYLEEKEDLYRTCRIEFHTLSDILSIENGIYVPSKEFGKFMSETKLRLNLAYGKKSSESKYLLSLMGYDRLISCVVMDRSHIEIETY